MPIIALDCHSPCLTGAAGVVLTVVDVVVALVVVEVVVDSIVVVGVVACVVDAVVTGVGDVVGKNGGAVTRIMQLNMHRQTDKYTLSTNTIA